MDVRVKMDQKFWKNRFTTCNKAVERALYAYNQSIRKAAIELESFPIEELIKLMAGRTTNNNFWINEAIQLWRDHIDGAAALGIQDMLDYLMERPND